MGNRSRPCLAPGTSRSSVPGPRTAVLSPTRHAPFILPTLAVGRRGRRPRLDDREGLMKSSRSFHAKTSGRLIVALALSLGLTGCSQELGQERIAVEHDVHGSLLAAAVPVPDPITEFPLARGVTGITAGPDGNLWFTELNGNRIGRITPTGVITEFPLPTANSGPQGITAGPDGNLWFTEFNGNRIGRITPTGVITEFPLPASNRQAEGVAAGAGGNLWITEVNGNRSGRITPAGVI